MHVIIDMANQALLLLKEGESITSWIDRSVQRLTKIKQLCKRIKKRPIFVADAAYTTQEVQEKWKIRRERECETGNRRIPYCADQILCELIMKMNLMLVYDKSNNADDVIATICNFHPDNIILSRDRDFFRYDSGTFTNRVFTAVYENGQLILQKNKPNLIVKSSLNTLRMYFPKFCSSPIELFKIVESGEYIRGTAFPSAERNKDMCMHLMLRDYRRILYKCDVKEMFPVWNNNKVTWIQDIVKPSDIMFPNKKIIINDFLNKLNCVNEQHKETAIMMILEICATHNKTSFLQEVLQYFQ